jgi:hypothetical protein
VKGLHGLHKNKKLAINPMKFPPNKLINGAASQLVEPIFNHTESYFDSIDFIDQTLALC